MSLEVTRGEGKLQEKGYRKTVRTRAEPLSKRSVGVCNKGTCNPEAYFRGAGSWSRTL